MTDHFKQVYERLNADPVFSDCVIKTEDTEYGPGLRPAPYLVLQGDLGEPGSERFNTVLHNRRDYTLTIHAVGVNDDQARAWGDHAIKLLEGFRPDVPGWKSQAVKFTGSLGVDVDRDFANPIIYSTVDFELVARRSG